MDKQDYREFDALLEQNSYEMTMTELTIEVEGSSSENSKNTCELDDNVIFGDETCAFPLPIKHAQDFPLKRENELVSGNMVYHGNVIIKVCLHADKTT